MRFIILFFLIGAFTLYNTTGCESCDDFFNTLEGPELPLSRGSEALVYSAGDTLWLNGSYAAQQLVRGTPVEITDGGGLFTTRLFTFTPGSDTLRTASNEVRPIAERGNLISSEELNNGLTALLIPCTNGDCGFRLGLVLDSTGHFFLSPQGGEIDRVNDQFNFCNSLVFSRTTLSGNNHLQDFDLQFAEFQTADTDELRLFDFSPASFAFLVE